MLIHMLKCKIHRATVKEAKLDYVGSITVDTLLMEAAGLLPYEKVLVVDLDNGNRFETYVIPGERASGMLCVNGAAAHLVKKGNQVIVMSFCSLTTAEAQNFQPTVVFVDEQNHVASITNYEKHGEFRCE